ncbi:MAG: sulfite exporter TauE/SafE family protein [Candidatus Parcubacteria bacterium]|nr:sulfite exporter TauE/SafE family protein [Candidatus Parcubacteria bacterium]
MNHETKEAAYYAKGMHCASCEILIETKLTELNGVKKVEASTAQGKILVKYEGEKPSLEKLNNLFKESGYTFFDSPNRLENSNNQSKDSIFTIGLGLLVITVFLGLNKLGLANFININSKSSLPAFFIFGLMAGISTCAALVGGIVLSMSKQWNDLYTSSDSIWKKIQPHLIFNTGRLISYSFLGAVLGLIGSKLNLSLKFGPFFVLGVSLMMALLALQMLGSKLFLNIQFKLPKFITKYIADESNFKGRYMPLLMGALTFFLPCGFTITAQGLALISGSPIEGGLIMFAFALGTLPMLLIIGLSSVKFSQNPQLAAKFLKVAGILVLFFALYNINAQLNVLGAFSLSDLKSKPNLTTSTTINKLLPSETNDSSLIKGKQVIKMDASSKGYTPNYFTVKVGIPVRWEITDKGTSGCTNAVISKSLFEGNIPLINGQTSIKEFIPTKLGKYKFSCWMGMISGTIEVIQ